MQCIQELLASRADYRNYETFVYRNCILKAHKNCWHLQINCKADYRNYQTFVYRNHMLTVYRNCLRLSTAGLLTGIARHLLNALANSMYTGIAGNGKQQGWIQELPNKMYTAIAYSMYTGLACVWKQQGWWQELPNICRPQLNTQCIQELLAFVNSWADYGNYQTLYTEIAYSMYEGTAGICTQQSWKQELPDKTAIAYSMYAGIACICKQQSWLQELLKHLYRKCILNVCRICSYL